MTTYTRYFIKALIVLIVSAVVLYAAAYMYIVAHKQEIIALAREQVTEKLHGDISIRDINISFLADFPSISADLMDVSVRDTMYGVHRHAFLEAKHISSAISLVRLVQNDNPLHRIKIRDATIIVFTDTTGYSNKYLLSPKHDSSAPSGSSSKSAIENVKLSNTRFILQDEQKRKRFDVAAEDVTILSSTNGQNINIKANTEILIHELAFNQKRGSFFRQTTFKSKIDLVFRKDVQQLSFQDTRIELNGHPFTIAGVFNFNSSNSFQLRFVSHQLALDAATRMLTNQLTAIISKAVTMKKPLTEAKGSISGSLTGGDPLLRINWATKDNQVHTMYADFSNCSFSGGYNNEVVAGMGRKDDNSRIEVHQFTGTYSGVPVQCKNIFIDNLVQPVVSCDLRSRFQLTQLNDLMAGNTFAMKNGSATVDVIYSGPVAGNTRANTRIDGIVRFSNGTIEYLPKSLPLENCSGAILFKQTDVYVKDLKGSVKNNSFVINGSGRNLLAFLGNNTGRAKIDWNVYLPSTNIGTITALLQKRRVVKTSTSSAPLRNTAAQIDRLITQADFHLNVKAGQVLFKKFKASDVAASLRLVNEDWLLDNISLHHAGGTMQVNGVMRESGGQMYSAAVNVGMQKVDVKQVLYAFDNFGQDAILSENLRGKLDATIHMNMDIDRTLARSPNNLAGFVEFSLTNGALLHFEPLRKLQNVIFKKRNFDEIYFAELKDRLDINRNEIRINRMEIQSTVLTLFVEGLYDLNKVKTDISIQVPLKNLKKRDDQYVPVNKGADAKAGMSVYVRGRPGKDGNIEFKVDLFKKFRKGGSDNPNR